MPGADGGSDGGMSSGGNPVARAAFLAACSSLRAARAARRSAMRSFCESVLPAPDDPAERCVAHTIDFFAIGLPAAVIKKLNNRGAFTKAVDTVLCALRLES